MNICQSVTRKLEPMSLVLVPTGFESEYTIFCNEEGDMLSVSIGLEHDNTTKIAEVATLAEAERAITDDMVQRTDRIRRDIGYGFPITMRKHTATGVSRGSYDTGFATTYRIDLASKYHVYHTSSMGAMLLARAVQQTLSTQSAAL